MKTKIIPFDLETAKKIQSGEIEGKILNNLKEEVRIVCFDREDPIAPIIALFKVSDGEGVMYVRKDGSASNCRDILVLKVPDNKPQFKPFDKVLVRDCDNENWETAYFSHIQNHCGRDYYRAGSVNWDQCIPYAGNEHLVGTTDKPKELC